MRFYVINMCGLGLLLAVASCSSTSTRRWVENNEVVGNVEIEELEYGRGYIYRYRSHDGKLQKMEYRNQDEQLLEGGSTTEYLYSADGKWIGRKSFDATGALTMNLARFAEHRIEFSVDAEGKTIRSDGYFDASNRPCRNSDGYSVQQTRFDRNGRIEEIRFLSAEGNLTTSDFLGVKDVTRVEFSTIKGVRSTVAGVFFGDGDKILCRRMDMPTRVEVARIPWGS